MSSYRILDLTATPQLNAVAISGTNTVSTIPIDVASFNTTTYQVQWTGTPTGVISVTGSIDGNNFLNFGASVATQPAGSAGGVLIPIYGSGMKWLKVSYTNSTGSGTMTVTSLSKTR